MPLRDHLALVLLLAVITILVYFDSFNNSFVYDDYPFIVNNKAIRELSLKNIVSNFTDRNTVSSSESLSRDVWRPLVTTSFALDYKFWKFNPRFYHIENTFFHLLNAILVYLASLLILESGIAAFLASAVFAIHPVQAEAVVWASGRSNVLFLFFFLLSFISHIRNRNSRKSYFYYSLSLIFFTCSLLSKEMGITLPLILLLYDIHFSTKRDIRSYLAYYTPFFMIAAFYVLTRFSVLGVIAQKGEWWGGGPFHSILATLKALAEYIRLLFMPVNLKVIYPIDTPKSVLSGDILGSMLVLSIIAFLYIRLRRDSKFSFYIAWFFATLIPVYNIVPFKAIMAERFLYLPLIGYASLFAMFFFRLKSIFNDKTFLKRTAEALPVIILILYGFATISRNIEWRDEITFYTQEVARSPSNSKAHYNLGFAYAKEAKRIAASKDLSRAYYGLAIMEFKETLSLKPDSQIAYFGLGNAYNDLGLYDMAIKDLRKAAVLKEHSDVYNNLAVAYYNKDMYDEAILSCKKALYLDPYHINAHVNFGNAYFMKGEYRKAKMAWDRAFELGSRIPSLLENIRDLKKLGY